MKSMAKAMKSMKSMKAMKAMKAMKSMKKKAMKVSVIAMYKSKAYAKRAVFTGKKMKTVGGLKKENLVKSKSGRIVSKKCLLGKEEQMDCCCYESQNRFKG